MNTQFFQKPLLTTQKIQASTKVKEKLFKRKSSQQSAYIDNYLSKQPTQLCSSNVNRPLLSIGRKFEIEKSTKKFQNTLTDFQFPKYKQDRMYQTISNGFTFNERPISKQQSRSRAGDTGILYKKDKEELIISQLDNIENKVFDETTNNQISVKIKRPETSKGQRNKIKGNNKIRNHNQITSDLFSPQKIKKQIYGQHRSHPNSAVERNRGSKLLDDIIKINTKPSIIKFQKSKLPFASSIDNDFLSLFASHD